MYNQAAVITIFRSGIIIGRDKHHFVFDYDVILL